MPGVRPRQRLDARNRPPGAPVMYHHWTQLLFAHWEVDADAIQKTLPAGLSVDTWQGKAYLGVVPFFMRRVRPRFVPPVPWFSNFLEMNVRTYVHDASGHPGVWFYSLDCNQPIAVWGARQSLSLPYFNAGMNARRVAGGPLHYRSHRFDGQFTASFEYRLLGEDRLASPESFDFFLIERYLLFTLHQARLYRVRVHHAPYRLQDAHVPKLALAGAMPAGADCQSPPVHLIGSPGVAVEVFAPEAAG